MYVHLWIQITCLFAAYWFISGSFVEAQWNGFVLVNACRQRASCSWTHLYPLLTPNSIVGLVTGGKLLERIAKMMVSVSAFVAPIQEHNLRPSIKLSMSIYVVMAPPCHSSTSVPWGWSYFVKITMILFFIVSLLARDEKPGRMQCWRRPWRTFELI